MATRVFEARRSAFTGITKTLRCLLPLAALAAGCGGMDAEEAVEVKTSALVGPQTFTITVPRGVDFRQVLFGGSNSVRVSDGVQVVSAGTDDAQIASAGPV